LKYILRCDIDELFCSFKFIGSVLWSREYEVKKIPLQAWTGPEGYRRMGFPNFKAFGT
jgi:hypothetical protein